MAEDVRRMVGDNVTRLRLAASPSGYVGGNVYGFHPGAVPVGRHRRHIGIGHHALGITAARRLWLRRVRRVGQGLRCRT